MKYLQLIMLATLSLAMNAQITVTTITPEFKGSGALSLDADGNLYIADFGDMLGGPDTDGIPNNVMKLDTNLELSVFATDFVGASGNDFDANGILYQADIRDNAIYKIIDGERELVTADGIVAPVGVVFDSEGNFYVCNCGNNTIRKVTPAGLSTLFSSGDMFSCPNGITIDENDNLYVVNFSNTNIVKITPDGTPEILANTPQENGHIDYDPQLRILYIASHGGNQIFYLPLNSPEVVLLAGTGVRGNDDGAALQATFSTPNGIAVGNGGNTLFVNCAVPLGGAIINPQVVRKIDGLILLSVTENSAFVKKVKVFPNPADTDITIQATITSTSSNFTLRMYDVLGKLQYENEKISNNGPQFSETISLGGFTSGHYFYTVTDGAKKLFSGKFLKK